LPTKNELGGSLDPDEKDVFGVNAKALEVWPSLLHIRTHYDIIFMGISETERKMAVFTLHCGYWRLMTANITVATVPIAARAFSNPTKSFLFIIQLFSFLVNGCI